MKILAYTASLLVVFSIVARGATGPSTTGNPGAPSGRAPTDQSRAVGPRLMGSSGRPAAYDSLLPRGSLELKNRMSQLEQERAENIRLAMNLITACRDDAPEVFRVTDAVKYLGLVRAEESVPLLLDMIDFRFAIAPTSAGALPSDRASIEALGKIGQAASKMAVEYLAKDKSTLRSPMYLRVIYLVDGPDVGKFMLEQAAQNEKDPDRKSRLDAAITLFADAGMVVH